jgi:hypothetical protein
MKTFLLKIVSLFLLTSCINLDLDEKKFKGEFNYTKKEQEMAKNKFGVEFKKRIYETHDKTEMYYIGGSIYHNYDLFSKSYHINGFTQLGLEF